MTALNGRNQKKEKKLIGHIESFDSSGRRGIGPECDQTPTDTENHHRPLMASGRHWRTTIPGTAW